MKVLDLKTTEVNKINKINKTNSLDSCPKPSHWTASTAGYLNYCLRASASLSLAVSNEIKPVMFIEFYDIENKLGLLLYCQLEAYFLRTIKFLLPVLDVS